MNYLKDYREGEKFVGTYLCKQKQILRKNVLFPDLTG